MTRTLNLGVWPPLVAHVADGVGWLARGVQQEPPGDALPLLTQWTEEQAFAALTSVPAWRLLDAAQVEVGARVLVLGEGWLCDWVRRIARLRGAFAADAGASADAVILVGRGAQLSAALQCCRSNGSLAAVLDQDPCDLDVYPDLHRRGLRLSLIDPCAPPHDWPRLRGGLARFIVEGSLAT